MSEDGNDWLTVKKVTDSPMDGEEVNFNGTPARFVRMHGIQRNMGYGYSILELLVFGTSKLADVDTGIENATDADKFGTHHDIFRIDGRLVGKDMQAAKNLQPGVYICNGRKFIVRH